MVNWILNYYNSEYPLCKQIDYLNFTCGTCGKNLCKKHYHHELSCPFAKPKEEHSEKKDIKFKLNKCDFCKEDIKNIEPVECELCHGLFCLKHRLEFDHKCSMAKKESIEDVHKRNRELVKQRMAEMKKKYGKK